MSTLFYKYIVDNILVDYFSNKIAKAGEHYSLVIENNAHRKGIIEAFANSSHSKSLVISEIYEGRMKDSGIDRYETCEFDADDEGDSVPLIIADVDSGKEYLPTIRNSVNKGKKYEKYATLFILSNNAAVDTLSTASINLESAGYPLCAKEIKKYINNKLTSINIPAYESEYIKKSLEKIAEQIENESCDLFDFEDVLHVLEAETIEGSFNKLEYFNDGAILKKDFKDKQIKKRIEENQFYFNAVNAIISNPDDDDKEESLCKYLDEKMAKHIASNPDCWQSIDFSEIKKSIDKKNATANLAKLKVSFFDEKGDELSDAFYYYIPGPTNKKKSTSYYIICHKDLTVSAKIEFNKIVKDKISDNKIKTRDRFVLTSVGDKVVNFFVGEGDNRHSFSLLKLPVDKSVFENIAMYTKISAKGDLIVTVPEDVDSLTIGNGTNDYVNPKEEIEWNDDCRIVLQNDDVEETKKNVNVDFYGHKIKMTFNFDNAKVLPKQPLDFFEYIWTNKESFFDARSQNFSVLSNKSKTVEYSTSEGRFRDLLVLENQIIQKKMVCVKDYDESGSFTAEKLDLDEKISDCLNKIFLYYQRIGSIPTLSFLDDEITSLYKEYLNSVLQTVEKIEPGANVSKKQHSITKLGVVECTNGDVWLSPLHPINVAFILSFKENFDGKESHRGILKLIGPYYLIPFLSINSTTFCPQMDEYAEDFKTWLFYGRIKNFDQNHTYNIATQMVKDKLNAFLTQFKYLFKSKECPIILNTFGISDDTNIIKGIIQYIISQCQNNNGEQIQKIELHEYVKNIYRESFYERLNRLGSDDYIVNELQRLKIKIDGKEKYTSREIIHVLFTRVSFFKHEIKDSIEENDINYSHIAFYQMDTNSEYYSNNDIIESYPNTDTLRTELSLNGLISIPSTKNKRTQYILGYGSKGVRENHSVIYDVAKAMNEIYTVEKQDGLHMGFQFNRCIAKVHKFDDQKLLQDVYDTSNWVTFLNPEVDLDFFYKQKNVYIIHYTDQYTINAKYDSITVTTHTDRYNDLIYNSFDEHLKSSINKEKFAANMFACFNSLNGRWLMNVANEQKYQVQEKISLVATVNVMSLFLKNNKGIVWVPVSLDEILRVSGSIGLPKEYIFTAKDLNLKGQFSDDLLMIGLVYSNETPSLYFYPVEVKYGDSNLSEKGETQVANTYNLLRKKLFGEEIHFVKKVYKTFFASQFLANAEKLKANTLLSEEDYEIIESFRFDLLNGSYAIAEKLPNETSGVAALVTFNSDTNHIQTAVKDCVPICHINLNKNECFKFVEGTPLEEDSFLLKEVSINDEFHNCFENISNNVPEEDLYLEGDESDESVAPPFVGNEPGDSSSESETVKDTSGNVGSNDDDLYSGKDSTGAKLIESLQPEKMGIQLVIGTTLKGSSKIFLYPNDTNKVTHPNMGIIGTMGTGKTQFARSIIAQFSKESCHNVNQSPIGMLVFDYKGDYNDEKFLSKVGGSCFKFNFPFNPLKLVITEDSKSMNLPARTAGTIADSMAKSFGLGDVQSQIIKDAIKATYESVGITKDSSTWHINPPTMQDVVDYYLENNDAKDKAYKIFSTLNDYQLFTDDASNCVSLFEWLNSVRVIDLTLYEDSVKKLIVSLILDLFYAEMKQLRESATDDEFRQLRAMILVDEAHQFMKMKYDSLRKIISEGRMFGVGMILSTQNLSDFKADEDYSSFIKSWVVHNVGTVKTSDMNSIFGPDPQNDKYQKFISQANKFESVCKIGTFSPVFMRDVPYYKLIEEDERFK